MHAIHFQYHQEWLELGFPSDVLREVKELHKIGLVSNATFDTLRNKATLLSFNICEPETNKLEKHAIVTTRHDSNDNSKKMNGGMMAMLGRFMKETEGTLDDV